MLSRPQARSSLERSGISWSPLWKCVRTFVYAFEPSPLYFWAEGSNEGPSTQHFRSILQPIYHLLCLCFLSSSYPMRTHKPPVYCQESRELLFDSPARNACHCYSYQGWVFVLTFGVY